MLNGIHQCIDRVEPVHGGVVLLVYLLVACVCGWTSLHVRACYRRSLHDVPSIGYIRRRRFWLGAGGLLAILAGAVQLGWIDVTSELFRRLAFTDGWYPYRWWVQGPIAALLIGLVIVVIIKAWQQRGEWYRRDQCMITAVVALLGLTAVRSLSQHHVDVVLGVDVFGLSLGRGLECTALAVLFIGAVHTMRCRGVHEASEQLTCGTVRDESIARRTVSTSTEDSNGLYTIANA